jgi:galactokinase/mevalonate kinase-like predicted kinase
MSSGIDSSMQAAVAGEVNKRMTNAVQDLQDKYAAGKGGTDASETGPTGEVWTLDYEI